MFDYQPLYDQLLNSPAREWLDMLPQDVATALQPKRNGHFLQWQEAVHYLPSLKPSQVELQDRVKIGCKDDTDEASYEQLETGLKQLLPWRKGPLDLFGVYIDTEWRSDWKWERLADYITPLKDRTVLDIGCGNGYYALRMLGMGANLVVGLDPSILYTMQYEVIKRYLPEINAYVLPLGVQHLPEKLKAFDTVFSMGVLYHQRSPLDHLQTLHNSLKLGGEVVLETIVIPEDYTDVLIPKKRYAQMRNVWSLPNCKTLTAWLDQCGFEQIQVVDVTPTTIQEQRRTDWITSHSLENFLDPNDHSKTIEGYPAPRRAIVIAQVST
ncbi:MAG: tRNA 5-methoxyuridine(34)/uridine 5-oxyacetic acid(34) synthase CmoB [Halothece sp. Uz-M2-17]|nr:tRNA 5-methoxyuridine(34)/uridine 5-oxyacetic acid(34) synthase CmoB [Halothece sp. Uz-M2-17]